MALRSSEIFDFYFKTPKGTFITEFLPPPMLLLLDHHHQQQEDTIWTSRNF